MPGPIVTSVQAKLESLLPSKIRIRNDSKGHASHYTSDGSEASQHGETHLALTVVSEKFEGLSRVKRHQLVYDLLSEEFEKGLHALQLSLKTSKESVGHDEVEKGSS
jgi:BolA protein